MASCIEEASDNL